MLAVLITLAPVHQNKFIDSQNAKVGIAILPITHWNTTWILTLELLEQAN
jgi:hypothetical protein